MWYDMFMCTQNLPDGTITRAIWKSRIHRIHGNCEFWHLLWISVFVMILYMCCTFVLKSINFLCWTYKLNLKRPLSLFVISYKMLHMSDIVYFDLLTKAYSMMSHTRHVCADVNTPSRQRAVGTHCDWLHHSVANSPTARLAVWYSIRSLFPVKIVCQCDV